MNEETHPSEQSAIQRYRRTVKLANTTSRLKNLDWYKDALELDVQVHMYLSDETGPDCYLFKKSSNHYEKLEKLNESQLEKHTELEKYVDQVLELDAAKGAKSLGFVLYLADELSIASLGPEHQNPAELMELNEMMIDSPIEVLEDKTVSTETHAWNLFPYPGAAAGSEFATAVAVSRKSSHVLEILRKIGCEKNIPIVTSALSAPLNAIAALPWFVTANEHGTIVVLNYRKFTLFSIMNEHCDLMMIRYMPHPNGASAPSNLGSAALATASSFELESPEINVFAMEGQAVDGLIVSLQSSMISSDIMLVDTTEIFKSKSLPEDLPMEMVATTQELDAEVYPLVENATFSTLRDERWHLQNFLHPDQEEADMFPSASDMNFLRISRKVKKIAALLLLGFVVFAGISTWRKMSSEAWGFKASSNKATASALGVKLNQHRQLDSLLQDRSKAWVSMELVQRLVPIDGSVILKDVNHYVAQKPEVGKRKYGMQKEWVINGFATAKGLPQIKAFGDRDGIKKIFNEVAIVTGNEAYLTNIDKRDVTVSFKQKANPLFNKIGQGGLGVSMPHAFNLTITQSFRASDSLAIAGIKKITRKGTVKKP